MDIALSILALVLFVVGVVGCVVPVIPGQIVAFCGYLCYYFCSYSEISLFGLIAFLLLTAVVTIIDFALPSYFAKLFGGSKWGAIGAFIGLVVGLIVGGVLGILIGPFLGAMAGELIHDRTDFVKALKVGFGSFLSFVLGSGLKLVLCFAMLIPICADLCTHLFSGSSGADIQIMDITNLLNPNALCGVLCWIKALL